MAKMFLFDGGSGRMVEATKKNYSNLIDQQKRKAVVKPMVSRDDLLDQIQQLETAWLDQERCGDVKVAKVFEDIKDMVNLL